MHDGLKEFLFERLSDESEGTLQENAVDIEAEVQKYLAENTISQENIAQVHRAIVDKLKRH